MRRRQTLAAILLFAIITISMLVAVLTWPSGPTIIKVGESLKYGDDGSLLITFTGVKLVAEIDGRKPERGRVFCVLNITFENIGKTDIYPALNIWIFGMVRGTALVADGYEFYDYQLGKSFDRIGIREKVDTYVYYEILEGLTPTEFRWNFVIDMPASEIERLLKGSQEWRYVVKLSD